MASPQPLPQEGGAKQKQFINISLTQRRNEN
jgi:hypothetical protein